MAHNPSALRPVQEKEIVSTVWGPDRGELNVVCVRRGPDSPDPQSERRVLLATVPSLREAVGRRRDKASGQE